MLDELLGRAALKERIEELEAERDRLEDQLAAEQERRATAASARQDAEERVNRLEDRIADLEGQLERAREGERRLEFRGTETVSGGRLGAVLDRLESFETGPEGALTAMVDGSPPDPVRAAFGERAALVGRAAPCLAVTDDAGMVSAALAPAVPPAPFAEWGEGFRLDRAWFEPTGRFGFALVRSDLFAYGEYEGRDRVAFEGFGSDVQANHSKGGFSQARFERRRDDQIEGHLERARAALEETAAEVDRLFVTGERTVLGEVADLATATARVDATGDPEPALEDAFAEFWRSTLYRI